MEPERAQAVSTQKSATEETRLSGEPVKAQDVLTQKSVIKPNPLVEAAGLLVVQLSALFNRVAPLVVQKTMLLMVYWKQLEPYHPEYVSTILLGLLLLYFGGTFMTVVAAVEAYRISSWEQTLTQLRVLTTNFAKALEASAEDDLVDDDKDGVADVKQIGSKELIERKIKLFIKTVDPMQVMQAFGQLYTGFLAVVATLRIKFAAAITLGTSLGDALYSSVAPFAVPPLKYVENITNHSAL
jgi:hypothetical protein